MRLPPTRPPSRATSSFVTDALVQNRGQGLGFVMGGMVVDRKTLFHVTLSLLTGTLSAITYVYGFMDHGVPADAEGSTVG